MSKRSVVLMILDGWGMGRPDESNPIHVVDPQNINYLKYHFPSGTLQASGISVGLPWGEEGNSEVGHLNIGAGKIMYQHFPRITLSVRDKSFFKNEALKSAFEHAHKNKSALNIIGLLGSANVHSSLEHLNALIEFANQEKLSNFNLHLFTDGRDSPPESALDLLKEIPIEKLASLSGRFYAMDRDKHWERTEEVYKTLIGNGLFIDPKNIEAHIKSTYEKELNDEYIAPTLIGPKKRPISDNDALIFFDFREDRMRQIISPFIVEGFKEFKIKPLKKYFCGHNDFV